jgi:hypothetical protein
VSYDAAARRRLADALRSGVAPHCPECGTPLAAHPIGPRADLPYVRRRVLLICPTCRRSAALDVTADAPP